MKKSFLILFIGITVTLVGLAASFVSAPKYGYIFAAIIVCDLSAASCFAYLFRLGGVWRNMALLFGLVVFYTLSDVILRIAFGIRVLDVM